MALDKGREQFNIVVVGHVDHGKSTVIGRLLADTGSLPDGKLEQVRAECARNAKPFEYAFLLDALKAEQAQGITIDTARCFFKSRQRDYIIIDAPGHIEFLKNMVTGAARAEAAVLVIDAKEGVRENSRRHGYMLGMLGIRQVVVAVNKMDLVNYDQSVFEAIVGEYSAFLAKIGIRPQAFVPIAAFHGVNLTPAGAGSRASQALADETGGQDKLCWYAGSTLLEQVDLFKKEAELEDKPLRLPVQDVYKFTEEGDDRRIIAGRVETGRVKAGDRVVFWPSGKRAKVKTLEEFNTPLPASFAPGKSAGLTLDPEIYVRQGEVMALEDQVQPLTGTRLRVNIFWMGREPFVQGRKYKLKLGTNETAVWLEDIRSVLDASNLESEARSQVDQYEVGECVLETWKPVSFDLNTDIAQTGRFVIVDGYEIAGGGIILESLGNQRKLLERHLRDRESSWTRSAILPSEREIRLGQKPTFVLLTGGEGGGQAEQTLAVLGLALEKALFARGRFVYYLGLGNALLGVAGKTGATGSTGVGGKAGGVVPAGATRGDSPAAATLDRPDLVRRLGETAHLFTDAGAVFVASVPGLEPVELDELRALAKPADVLVVRLIWPQDGAEGEGTGAVAAASGNVWAGSEDGWSLVRDRNRDLVLDGDSGVETLTISVLDHLVERSIVPEYHV